MTKSPHTGTQQPGSHPSLQSQESHSSFQPRYHSLMAPSCSFALFLVPPSKVREGRVWLALDIFLSLSALKVSVGCPLCSWRGQTSQQEHPWHWAEQDAPTFGQILAELGLAAGTSGPCLLCSGNSGSCRNPWKVPWQQTPIPSRFLSPSMPRGTAGGSGCLELSLFLNPPLHHLWLCCDLLNPQPVQSRISLLVGERALLARTNLGASPSGLWSEREGGHFIPWGTESLGSSHRQPGE